MKHPTDRRSLLEHIAAHPVEGSPEEMRAAFTALAGPQPDGKAATIGGVDVLTVGDGAPFVWLHGGGGVFGAPETHLALAHELASTGLKVILPRYPLAPEAPFSEMVEASLAVLKDVAPAVLGGDSFGGHLALVAALRRPELLRGLALLSPNTDHTGLSKTRAALSRRDATNDDAQDTALARMVFGDALASDPNASPALADLSAMPRTAVEVGSEEVLLDDSLILARNAILAGRPVMLRVTPGIFHLAALWPEAIPAARAMLTRLSRFAGICHQRG